MTCIVAIASGGRVWMGADSLITQGDVVTSSKAPKVYEAGGALIGFAGALSHAQAFRRWASGRKLSAKGLRDGSLVDSARKFIRARFRDEYEAEHIVAIGGELFVFDCTLGMDEPAEQFAAIGSGAQFALGALFASSSARPALRIPTALEAAERFSGSVRRPWSVAVA